MTETPSPSVFNCRQGRHKVLAGDGICVICGARRVVDARTLPNLDLSLDPELS